MSGRLSSRKPEVLTEPILEWAADLGDYVQDLRWSPRDGRLAACAISGTIGVFTKNGLVEREWEGHGFGTNALAWDRRGRMLASVGQNRELRIHHLDSDDPVRVEIGTAWGEAVAWSPKEDIVAAVNGRTLTLVERDGTVIRREEGHPSTISDLTWHPDGSQVALAHHGGISIWPRRPQLGGHEHRWDGSALTIAWSPNGAFVATGNQDAGVHFWRAQEDDAFQMRGYQSKVTSLSWDARGERLATNGGAGIVIWDCRDDGPVGTRPALLTRGHQTLVQAIAFAPKGLLLATGCEEGRLCLWNVERWTTPIFNGLLAGYLTAPDDEEPDAVAVSRLDWSPDGRRLAIGMEDGMIFVFRMV